MNHKPGSVRNLTFWVMSDAAICLNPPSPANFLQSTCA